MPCAGAADEQCGNGYKSSLYTSVSSVVKPLGCYVDSNPRILPDYSFKSASMTPLLCQSTCMSKGYSFAGEYNALRHARNHPLNLSSIAGVSYGSECYCGSNAPSTTAKTSDADCQQKCAGSTATCGGAWRTYVYSIGDTPVAAPSASTSTVTTTAVVVPSTTTKAPAATTTTPASTGLVALGCYNDNGSNRLMSYSAASSGSMTPSLCQSTCQTQGYDYAGRYSDIKDKTYLADLVLLLRRVLWTRMLVFQCRSGSKLQDLGFGLLDALHRGRQAGLRRRLQAEYLEVTCCPDLDVGEAIYDGCAYHHQSYLDHCQAVLDDDVCAESDRDCRVDLHCQ